MKSVILMKEVDTLGEQGEVVQVADGYARNFLLPNQLAIPATPGAMADRDRRSAKIKSQADKRHQEALSRAAIIEALGELQIAAQAGEEGKLFGAVTTRDIAATLIEVSGLEIDRRLVTTSTAIHHLGSYSAQVKLSPKVTAKIAIQVVRGEG
jgi:large subunit ribosomal protein L9